MMPNDVTMDADEHIVLVAHRHIVNVLPVFVATALILLASVLGAGWLTANQANLSFLPVPLITMALLVLDALALVISLLAFIIFRQSRIILTNKHFVEITQSGLFGRSLSKLSLDELQDVKGERRGVFATIFNYGQILIETAAAQENFRFGPVSDPLNVAEKINDQHEAYEKLIGDIPV